MSNENIEGSLADISNVADEESQVSRHEESSFNQHETPDHNQSFLDYVANMLTCPFCSEEYLFDFTMKAHLQKHHHDEISDKSTWPSFEFYCPYCEAMFYYSSVIPKHIYLAHGKEKLDEHFKANENLQKYQIDKENAMEPSVKFLDCSPGLSSMMNELDTCDSIKRLKLGSESVHATPAKSPRSILKKTPYSGKIVILSPESVALRRTINSIKRTASARRELRFDLPPLQKSPSDAPCDITMSPKRRPKKHFWNIFAYKKSPPPINQKIKKKIRAKACKMSNRSVNQMVTSTPMACLDDSDDDDGCDELDHTIGSNWKTALKTSSFRPLFLSAERFQCNFCQAKFDCNAELLKHQSQDHNKRKILTRPFKCGQCSSKFYRNKTLVRHCNHQHTRSKI